jgi:hypothetical protein
MDFDFWNLTSSGGVVYKDADDVNAHGYWFILRFCEHFACLSCKIKNAIKVENISSFIASQSINIHKGKTTENMKVSGFCYEMHFHYWLPLKRIS